LLPTCKRGEKLGGIAVYWIHSVLARRELSTIVVEDASCFWYALVDGFNVVLPALPIFKELVRHAEGGRIAIVDYSVSPDGEVEYSYAQLLDDVTTFRDELSAFLGTEDLNGTRVAFLVESGYNYVVSLFAIWALGGFAVPLCTSHPIHEMLYMVTDSGSTVLLGSKHFEAKISELAAEAAKDSVKRSLYIIPEHPPKATGDIPNLITSPIVDSLRHALMIYTSGTTGKPKVSSISSSNIRA
jgi:acyl-CoA synthetase (AMP-forming)/AMP-acid ligase II